uniref:ATP synthase complex subunit 8 n=1 Tax=Luprops yunnanus TaxID=2984368 RepID=A0A978AWA3_9CUCU|nr:ATP synthase F0 subunit 8 [Luprops yunnanus]UYB79046.1 ATP synthase F0 subunit 8 [Luprops yunnanus]
MPQMAPMNWFLLSITFITILVLFSTLSHFMSLPSIKNKSIKSNKNSLNWKW